MFQAFLIGGGNTENNDDEKTIEIFSPHFTNYPCSLPSYPRLDVGMGGHTQNGPNVCYSSDCWKLSKGKWDPAGTWSNPPRPNIGTHLQFHIMSLIP